MIYALSDLHLSFSHDKPMNVFGRNWHDYENRIEENWNNLVKDEDYVLVAGDVSWATYIDECFRDFDWLNRLHGNKIISKGNHDYWWCTHKKQDEYVKENNFTTLNFLHNNSYLINNIGICGARGWLSEDLCKTDEDKKIYNRELQRLEISINSIDKSASYKIAMLHYPPDKQFMEILTQYGINDCIYGHLHGTAHKNAIYGVLDNVRYNLTSCDYLNFKPLIIKE